MAIGHMLKELFDEGHYKAEVYFSVHYIHLQLSLSATPPWCHLFLYFLCNILSYHIHIFCEIFLILQQISHSKTNKMITSF